MILPQNVQEKVNELYASLNKKSLTETQMGLTEKYKQQTGQSRSLINSKKDSLLYAISRMPATFSVIYTLLNSLKTQSYLNDITTVLDVGSGTGAGYFALNELESDLAISLVERDENMIEVFKTLTDGEVEVLQSDALKFQTEETFDLVMTSYVLSEMTEVDRMNMVDKLLNISNKYILIIDTGTPRTYENMMKVKKYAIQKGAKIVAPCMTEKCGLVNDYCQFYARVERSSLHKMAKSGTLSYEDEKYFYLLIKKECNQSPTNSSRVIRRPIIKENNIELVLCFNGGVKKQVFTKKNKDLFKKAKKTKINDLI